MHDRAKRSIRAVVRVTSLFLRKCHEILPGKPTAEPYPDDLHNLSADLNPATKNTKHRQLSDNTKKKFGATRVSTARAPQRKTCLDLIATFLTGRLQIRVRRQTMSALQIEANGPTRKRPLVSTLVPQRMSSCQQGPSGQLPSCSMPLRKQMFLQLQALATDVSTLPSHPPYENKRP